MFRKLMWSSAGVAALGAMIFGGDAWSYLTTSVATVRQAVKREVPLEFEVQRARDLVQQVDGEIRRCLHVIAEDEVSIDELRKDVARQMTEHNRQRDQILVLRKDLEQTKDAYVYAGRAYTRSEVETDLADRFRRYQLVEETLASRKEVLAARDKALGAARRKLESMLDSKEQLEVQIENLEARMKSLQASQIASQVAVDESQVARTRQLIKELNRQIEVKQKLLHGEGDLTGLIPVETKDAPAADIRDQIDQYFGDASAQAQAAPEAPVAPTTPAAPTAAIAPEAPVSAAVTTGSALVAIPDEAL